MTPDAIYFFEAVVGLQGRDAKRKISKRTREEILGMVREKQGELETPVMQQHRAAGIEGFREAVKSGLLEIHPFRRTSPEALIEAVIRGRGELLSAVDLIHLLDEYLNQVTDAAQNGSTYPVFNDLTGDLVAEAISAGVIRFRKPARPEVATAGCVGSGAVRAVAERRERAREIRGSHSTSTVRPVNGSNKPPSQ